MLSSQGVWRMAGTKMAERTKSPFNNVLVLDGALKHRSEFLETNDRTQFASPGRRPRTLSVHLVFEKRTPEPRANLESHVHRRASHYAARHPHTRRARVGACPAIRAFNAHELSCKRRTAPFSFYYRALLRRYSALWGDIRLYWGEGVFWRYEH